MNMMTPSTALDALRAAMPVRLAPYALPERSGLVIVDEVNGFCTPGAGPLAPPTADPVVDAMVERTDALARLFLSRGMPVLAVADTHEADRPEPPYPPHCIRGSGHELLVDRLRWLETAQGARVMEKDCIDTVAGGVVRSRTGETANAFFEWITDNRLEAVVFVGIATDICVSDAVLSLLSARNHQVAGFGFKRPMLGALRDVVVYEPACATFDLPLEVARDLGLPDTSAHPRDLSQHAGLWMMQSRGAVLANEIA